MQELREHADNLTRELGAHREHADNQLREHRDHAATLIEERDAYVAHANALGTELAATREHAHVVARESEALQQDRDAWRARAERVEAQVDRGLSARIKRGLRLLVRRTPPEPERP